MIIAFFTHIWTPFARPHHFTERWV